MGWPSGEHGRISDGEPFRFTSTLQDAAEYLEFDRNAIPPWFTVWHVNAAREHLLQCIENLSPADTGKSWRNASNASGGAAREHLLQCIENLSPADTGKSWRNASNASGGTLVSSADVGFALERYRILGQDQNSGRAAFWCRSEMARAEPTKTDIAYSQPVGSIA